MRLHRPSLVHLRPADLEWRLAQYIMLEAPTATRLRVRADSRKQLLTGHVLGLRMNCTKRCV